MICFKDMTFCGSDCVNQKCPRFFSKADKENAILWWGNENAPIAYSDFSDQCLDYKRPTK